MNRYERYEPVHFRVGMNEALASVLGAAARDGYELGGEISLLDTMEGAVHHVVLIGGEWYEGFGLIEEDGADAGD